MRIADVLLHHHDDDGAGVGGGERPAGLAVVVSPPHSISASSSSSFSSSFSASTASTTASSSRFHLSRWLRPLLKPSRRGGRWESFSLSPRKTRKKGKEAETPAVPPPPPPPVVADGKTVADRRELAASTSDENGMAAAVQGIGAGLIFLLAKSASELSKLTEMQRQMQTMLEEIKNSIPRKDVMPSFSEPNNTMEYSASGCCDDSDTRKTFSLRRTSLDSKEIKDSLESDSYSICATNVSRRGCPEMDERDELEAELEIELGRLELNLKREESQRLSERYGTKLAKEVSDFSGTFSIDIDENDKESGDLSCGVPARELEIKLHELLETRQQERIAELESALECAKTKLHEKEIEASQWRETALRVSNQPATVDT